MRKGGRHEKGLLVQRKESAFEAVILTKSSSTLVHHPCRLRLFCRVIPLGISQDTDSWSDVEVLVFFRNPKSSNLLTMMCAFIATCMLRGKWVVSPPIDYLYTFVKLCTWENKVCSVPFTPLAFGIIIVN
jgi:hypothetical protein